MEKLSTPPCIIELYFFSKTRLNLAVISDAVGSAPPPNHPHLPMGLPESSESLTTSDYFKLNRLPSSI